MHRNETEIRVRYKDTDAMGIAYYANYLVWFEIGRTEWMRALSIPHRDLEKSGLFIPVIKVSCEYRSPARYDDQITVITSLESMSAVRISFLYELRCAGRLLAHGSTEHAFVNEEGRPVALRKKNPFLWKKLSQVLENPSGS